MRLKEDNYMLDDIDKYLFGVATYKCRNCNRKITHEIFLEINSFKHVRTNTIDCTVKRSPKLSIKEIINSKCVCHSCDKNTVGICDLVNFKYNDNIRLEYGYQPAFDTDLNKETNDEVLFNPVLQYTETKNK
jgi:hypothetical protein